MKKKLFVLMTLLVFSLGTFTMAYANTPIKLFFNGTELKTDTPPQNMNGKVLVPIKVIAEAFGAGVSWDSKNHAVIIKKPDSKTDKTEEARIAQLERALAPKDPLEAVNTWYKGAKDRNGAVQYAVLSPELRKTMYNDCAGMNMNWVTGVSSPWIDSYKITELGKGKDGSYQYKVDIIRKTSTGNEPPSVEYVTVKKYDNNYFISSIGNVDIRGKITKLEKIDNKTASILVEGQKQSDTFYDKAKVKIDSSTRIIQRSTGRILAASDLKVGMKVEVKFVGPVNYSYPVQAKAGEIKVIE